MGAQSASNASLAGKEASRKPKVSVIIGFLNAVRFIEETIESVCAQTYQRWELLLVDDGSTDGSSEIAQRYSEQYPEKVRLLEHERHRNEGVAASRNLGVRHARGDYVATLDADDVWLPHKLEQQAAILSSHPDAVMVYGLDEWWYSWTRNPEDRQRDFRHELGVPAGAVIEPPTLLDLFFFRQQAAIPCPSGILIRRETLDAIGNFEESFRGRFSVYEDQAFFAKIALKAPVLPTNACWNRYRQHPSSACSTAKSLGQEYEARRFFLDWLGNYLSESRVKDPAIWKAFEKERWRCRHPRLSALLNSGKLGQP